MRNFIFPVGGSRSQGFRKYLTPKVLDLDMLASPDPPIPAFFDFLAFFVFRFSLLFLAFFLPFPRILGVAQREKPLHFWEKKTLAFSKKARVGGSGSIAKKKPYHDQGDSLVWTGPQWAGPLAVADLPGLPIQRGSFQHGSNDQAETVIAT